MDIPDEDGNSSLDSSVATGKIELFTLLLARGARATENTFEMAKLAGRSQMRKILEHEFGMKLPKGSGLAKHCCQCRARAPKMLMCSGCSNATYCSKDCQILAWENHKPHCQAQSTASTSRSKTTSAAAAEVVVTPEEVARAAAAELDLLKLLEEEEEEEESAKKKNASKNTMKQKKKK